MAPPRDAEGPTGDGIVVAFGYGLFVLAFFALLVAPWSGPGTAILAVLLALMAAVFLGLVSHGTLPAVPPRRLRLRRGLIARERTKYSGIRFLRAAPPRPRLPGF